MKKIITFLIFLSSITLFAQLQQRSAGSLNIISNNGVKFKLYLNGELQNRTAKASVRIDNLSQRIYSAKIQLQDVFLSAVTENNIILSDRNALEEMAFYDVTYKITVDRNNKAKLVLISRESVIQKPIISPGIGNGGNRPPYGGGGRPPITQPRGCTGNREVRQAEFQNIKNAVNSEKFTSDKVKLLNRLITENCMSTNQISDLMKTYFTFDSDRLAVAILAYDYCVDPKNYYQLNSLLIFSSSKDKLYQHIQSRG